MRKKKIVIGLLETLLVNIIIYYLFYKFQYNQDTYLTLNPHPLFILCILIAMRYGNYSGIACALITSLFYGYVFISIHGNVLSIFADISNYKYILLFFWSAIILGTFKDNHDAKITRLSNEIMLYKDSYKQLEKAYKVNQKLLSEFKKQIINSEESILNLYEIASRLSILDAEEIYTETMGILSKYLKSQGISIYTFDEKSGYLRLKIRLGNDRIENRSLLVKDSPGLLRVVFDKQVLRWSDVKEEAFPLMAAPIIRDNKVLAIVNIEHMDYDHLSEYAFQLFKLIIDWVNKAMQQAHYVDRLTESKYYSGTRIMTYEAFTARQKSEERRKKEFGMDYSILRYRVKGLNINILNERIKTLLRAVDVIGYESAKRHVLILLPATPKDMAFRVEERLLKSFNGELEKIEDFN